jgi:hypothetical protein
MQRCSNLLKLKKHFVGQNDAMPTDFNSNLNQIHKFSDVQVSMQTAFAQITV